MNDTLQVRIDKKTKKAAGRIFESLGMDLSSGIKVYLTQVLRTKSIPFPLLTENGFTSEQEKKINAISKQAEKDLKAGKLKLYSSWDEAKKDILK